MAAEGQLFISKYHQKAIAMEGDEISVETKLTKGDTAPRPAEKCDKISELTESTRESKAKRYAVEEVKIVAKSYIGTTDNLTTKLEKETNEKADMKAQLAAAMKVSEFAQKKNTNKNISATNNFTEDSIPRSRQSGGEKSIEVESDKNKSIIESGEEEVEIINAENEYSSSKNSEDEFIANSHGLDAKIEQELDSLEQDCATKSPSSPFRKGIDDRANFFPDPCDSTNSKSSIAIPRR